MNYYDGKIELEREVAALNAALAAERADCARAKESLDERCKTIIEQRTRIDFLDPYCKRLEEELAAEREKVVALEAKVAGMRADLQAVHDMQNGLVKDNLAYANKSTEDDEQVGYWKKQWLVVSDERNDLADRVRGLEGALSDFIEYTNENITHQSTGEDCCHKCGLVHRGVAALTPPAPQQEKQP